MKKVLFLALLALAFPAKAQTVTNPAVAAMVCANNTVVPTPVNGQFFYVQCDANGKLVTTASSTSAGITIGTSAIANGTDTRVLFQDGLVIGEDAAFTFAKTTGTLSIGREVIGGTGAASTAVGMWTGAFFTGGTATTQFPALFVQPTSTAAVTSWSTGGTVFGVNAPSGFAGNFLDFHVAGGGSLFSVLPAGGVMSAASITAGSQSALQWNGRGILTSSGVGTTQFGAADVDTNASIIAQTVRSQGTLAGGTSNQAGKDFTFLVSPGKGTGIGGSFILQTAPAGTTGTTVNAGVTAFKLDSTGLITLPVIASDAALTDTTVCQDTTNHGLRSGSGALGICLGTSGRQFKTDFAPMAAGLPEIMKINLWNYRYKPGYGDNGARMQYGPTAQDVEAVLPDLAGHDAQGATINYDWGAFIPIALRAIQQLKADNDNLRLEINKVARR